MSKFWFFLFVVVSALLIWCYFKCCPGPDDGHGIIPPTSPDPIGFESIEVSSSIVDSIYKRFASVSGFRVYNAREAGSLDVGLIVGAVDQDSSETFDNGKSYYLFVESNGSFRTDIPREEAIRMVMNVVNDREIANLITSFYSRSLSDFWQGNDQPDTFTIIPAEYREENCLFNSANIKYLAPIPGGGNVEHTIISRPCPPNCPDRANMLYSLERSSTQIIQNNDEERNDEKE